MNEVVTTDEEKTGRAYNKIHSRKYKKVMTNYYRNSKIIPKIPFLNKKVAWVTSGAPVELLVAAGTIVLYPENYAAIVGGSKVAVESCQIAENEGFSNELCSYARCHLGTVFKPSDSVMGGLSKPDFLVSCNNICGTVEKWFSAIAEHLNIPHFHFDTPPTVLSQERHVYEYVRSQLDDYMKFIEEQTGKKWNASKIVKTYKLSTEATKLWIEILESSKNRPAPLNCPDRFITMGPVVTQRGLQRTVDVYKELLEEVNERIANGIGALKNEKIRLLWDNIAIWYNLYPFFNELGKRGIGFPVDTYTHAWSMSQEVTDMESALNASAKVYSQVYLNQDLDYRVELISRLIKEYECDGFVLHSNKACKRYSMGMLPYKKAITKKTGVPGVVIDGDMVDERNFSAEQTKTRIEGLIEIIENNLDMEAQKNVV
ncbi:MAG: 2-hydroxyacyl-CoA dehydratase subunit D [Candidatus Kariarchaeaceae archaeon]|jgi:benzoyl-CoA reductase/2-hydroxyglutaryl-CoA dehydratase subunit BcrC/BadD/HgdB